MKRLLILIPIGILTAIGSGCATTASSSTKAIADIQTAEAVVDVADAAYNVAATSGVVSTNQIGVINASVAAFNAACNTAVAAIQTGGTNYAAWVTNLTATEQQIINAINASK